MAKIELIHGDCMDYLKGCSENQFDLAIVDPPYGIGIAEWDTTIPKKQFFDVLFKVSQNHIIWGANYFHLPHSESWICWHKLKGLNKGLGTMSEFELAWTSHDKKAAYFGYTYLGNVEGLNKPKPNYMGNKKIHPTQKPVALYRWLLQNYAKKGDTILDTHGGSMSIAIACYIEGFDLVCIEKDKDYFEAAKKRYEDYVSMNPRMFEPEELRQPIQTELF